MSRYAEIKTKYLFNIYNGATPGSGVPEYWGGDIVWVTPSDMSKVDGDYLYDSERRITLEGLNSCGTNVFPEESIVISTRAPIGAVCMAGVPMCTNQGCKTLVSKTQENAKFYYYFMKVNTKQLNSLGRGTTFLELSNSDLSNVKVPYPSLQIQTEIVTYLDRKTARINEIISDKQKLIALHREKRQSIISEAVTRGLDKKAPMKESGVEWIGEIPQEWEMKPLFIVAFENQVKNTGNVNTNVLSLSYGKIVRRDVGTNFGLLPESFEGYQVVDEGYIILRLTDLQNDKNSLRSGYVTEKGIITSAYVGLVCREIVYSRFMEYLLHTYDLMKIFYGLGNGVRQSMNYKDLKWLPIPITSIEEQIAIADYLDLKTSRIDSTIKDIKVQINKLKEYRQCIISEVVTGKVMVENLSQGGLS